MVNADDGKSTEAFLDHCRPQVGFNEVLILVQAAVRDTQNKKMDRTKENKEGGAVFGAPLRFILFSQ